MAQGPKRPSAVGFFPARKMNLAYGDAVWCKARQLFFLKGLGIPEVSQATRIKYDTVRRRAYSEKWEKHRSDGTVPEHYLTPKEEIRKLRTATLEANVWIRRKKMDKRRLEVIEETAQKIMTREDKAKEALDGIMDRTPGLLKAMDDAVKGLETLRDSEGNLVPSAIAAVKDLVSAHGKMCDTLGKLEKTRGVNGQGLPVQQGWIGVLGAVRVRDEPRVLKAQVQEKVIELKEEKQRELIEDIREAHTPDEVLKARKAAQEVAQEVPFALSKG